ARYELAIVLPKRRDDAYQIVILSWVISSVVSLLTLLVIWLFESQIVGLLDNPEIGKWLYWIPLSIFLTGIYQSLYYWFNREKGYRDMANSRIVQSTAMVGSQIGFGFFTKLSALGLILGQVIGQVLATLYMGQKFIKDTRNVHKPKKLKQFALAKRYINFPKFLLIAHTMNATSRQLPSIFFNIFFTATVAGFYMLIQRVIGAPITIVGGAIGDVFRQQASKAYAERGECIREYKNTFKKLLIISVLPFAVFIFIAPDLFAIVFGENWREAGFYAQILTPMFFLQFVTSPLSNMFMIAEKQKLDLLWQTCLLIATGSAFIVGYASKDVMTTIIFFSVAYTLMYSINAVMTWKFAKGFK
ncbi:MAG: oligosaccharide flippase family protein, partial [Methyloprofundus sp.]|nr:oligosaccharide flippase family protein [Methyloprofundus sp.]